MATKAKISYKKECPNCNLMPAWYVEYSYSYNKENKEPTLKPVYSCGDCGFKLARKERGN